MSNNTPETSTIDRLFLELSQFTKAKTNAQITLEYKLSEAEKTIDRLCDENRQLRTEIKQPKKR